MNTAIDKWNMEKDSEEEVENPVSAVASMRNQSLIQLAEPENKNISDKVININNCISHRPVKEGSGLFSYQKHPDGVEDKLLFQEYINEKCGSFYKTREKSALDYQQEYLLYGKSSDRENLEDFLKSLYIQRYVVNTQYLFSNSQKQELVHQLALIVSSCMMQPELTEVITTTIMFAWSFAESVQDLRILMDGKRVASVKTDASWNTTLEEALIFTGPKKHYRETAGGKNYEDYLKIKLATKKESELRWRLMDIMEMDIRKTCGNCFFQMDRCLYQMEVTVNVSSEYGTGNDITRKYSYE